MKADEGRVQWWVGLGEVGGGGSNELLTWLTPCGNILLDRERRALSSAEPGDIQARRRLISARSCCCYITVTGVMWQVHGK